MRSIGDPAAASVAIISPEECTLADVIIVPHALFHASMRAGRGRGGTGGEKPQVTKIIIYWCHEILGTPWEWGPRVPGII